MNTARIITKMAYEKLTPMEQCYYAPYGYGHGVDPFPYFYYRLDMRTKLGKSVHAVNFDKYYLNEIENGKE